MGKLIVSEIFEMIVDSLPLFFINLLNNEVEGNLIVDDNYICNLCLTPLTVPSKFFIIAACYYYPLLY